MTKMALKKLIKDETGQVMILVLILLVVGGLIIAPLLSYMGTGLIVSEAHEEMAADFYAADSGVEDGLWQIKYDHLEEKLPDYDPYDFDIFGTVYDYPEPLYVNDRSVAVSIENIWIPKDIAPSSKNEARDIIEAGKLIIVGSVSGTNAYQIKIYYYKDEDDADLEVTELGIWLPPGFNYVEESSNLEDDELAPYYPSSVEITPHKGGEAVVWNFTPDFLFADLPGVNPLEQPMESVITFQFTGPSGKSPEALSWIITDEVSDIPYTWDADTKVYKITSEAYRDVSEPPNTTVEAYTSKCEIRKLGSAIGGDYRAIGATLMIDEDPWNEPPIRDTLLTESSAVVNDIPADAEVEAAYLYWSAWLDSGSTGQIIWEDDCSDFDPNWNPSIDWNESSIYTAFYGHDYGGDGTLLMKNSLNLSSYSGETVTASWRNWNYSSWRQESNDCLQYGFYDGSNWDWYDDLGICGDIGTSPVNYSVIIPDAYLASTFKIGFRIQNYGGYNEYIYIDNVNISVQTATIADTTAIFKIDGTQVSFDGDGLPQTGGEITASEWSLLENEPGEYSYSCYLDVTQLVRTFSDEGDYGNYPGNATYTVGGVDADTGNEWSYAAWSLLVIYSSSETKGHQLYLYDDFVYSGMHTNVDFDGDGEPGGTISGFLVVGEGDDYYNEDYLIFEGTALSDGITTSDVWNSWSLGLAEDGIDIDTFYVTWISGLLEPGDSSAQIDLPTETDSWNLVYIILSFRSEITTGGTITYLVRG